MVLSSRQLGLVVGFLCLLQANMGEGGEHTYDHKPVFTQVELKMEAVTEKQFDCQMHRMRSDDSGSSSSSSASSGSSDSDSMMSVSEDGSSSEMANCNYHKFDTVEVEGYLGCMNHTWHHPNGTLMFSIKSKHPMTGVPFDDLAMICPGKNTILGNSDAEAVEVGLYEGHGCMGSPTDHQIQSGQVFSFNSQHTGFNFTFGCEVSKSEPSPQEGMVRPLMLQRGDWLSASPTSAVEKIPITYELFGIRAAAFKGQEEPKEQMWAKISASKFDCQGVSAGPTKVDAWGKFVLAVQDVGEYRVCIRTAVAWEPLGFILKVTASQTDSAFYGANTCQGFLNIASGSPELTSQGVCGCFFERVDEGGLKGPQFNVEDTFPIHSFGASKKSFVANMGCCGQRTEPKACDGQGSWCRQERVINDREFWGYCGIKE